MTNWDAWLNYNNQLDNVFFVLGVIAFVLAGTGWFLFKLSQKWFLFMVKYGLVIVGGAAMVVGAIWLA
jgi:hypothetical protein